MNDLLDEIATPEIPPLTQADYDRAAKLNAGIAKFQAELDELKARIKAEAVKPGTKVHGNVVVKVTERRDKDIEAIEASLPYSTNPEFYKHVLDAAKVAKELPSAIVLKPAIKVVSITFADAD